MLIDLAEAIIARVGKTHRAGAAARPRQGQSYRQCLVRPRGGRPLDRAAHLHRADAGEAARPVACSSGASWRRCRSGCSAAIPISPMPSLCTRVGFRPMCEVDEFFFQAGTRLGVAGLAAQLYLRQLHPCARLPDRARRQRGRATRRQAGARRRDPLEPELQSRPHA